MWNTTYKNPSQLFTCNISPLIKTFRKQKCITGEISLDKEIRTKRYSP